MDAPAAHDEKNESPPFVVDKGVTGVIGEPTTERIINKKLSKVSLIFQCRFLFQCRFVQK